MDPMLDGRADTSVCSPKTGRMTLDQAFAALGWGVDDWPSEQEVRKRHRELLLKYHPDKAAEGLEEKHTEISSNLNRAKEIILRAHGLKNVQDDDNAAAAPPAAAGPATMYAMPAFRQEAASHRPPGAQSSVPNSAAAGGAPSMTGRAPLSSATRPQLQEEGGQAGAARAGRDDKLDGDGGDGERGREEEGGSLQRLRNFFDLNETRRAAAQPSSVWGEEGAGASAKEAGAAGEHAEERRGEEEVQAAAEQRAAGGDGAGVGREEAEAAGGKGGRGRRGGEESGELGEWEYVTRGSVGPTWGEVSGSLRLLAGLREGDKLVVTGDAIAIDSSWVLGGLSRFLTSQGRAPTASWLLRFAADVARFATALLNGMRQSVGQGRSGTHGRAGPSLSQEEMVGSLVRELRGCIEGLRRLKATYNADPRTTAQLVKVLDSLSETLHLLSRPSHRPALPLRRS